MPRSRQQPQPEGDEIDIGALLEEVRGIREERDELRTAIEELRTARTPSARRAATRDVDAAEEGLAKALRQHGYHDITADDLEDLRRSRRQSEFDAWFDQRLQRMDEELEAETAQAASGGAGKAKNAAPTRKAAKVADGADGGDEGGDGGAEGAEGRGKRGYF